MFHEQIGKLTADHLRTHIKAYLAAIEAEYTSTPKQGVTLTVPKSIEYSSLVGGMMTEFDKILPQYGVDVLSKVGGEDIENLFTYNYIGQINGLVSATSRDAVDKLCSRHARAVEYFVKQHQFLHKESNANFSILAFGWINLEFSGAENLGEYNDREIWIAGFSTDVVWAVSEDSMMQH